MGTTKSGRVLNTVGARGSASQYSVVHSNEGTYTKPQPGQKIRLKGGGHGQAGMNELDKYGIEYHIVKTYPNGVRVGYIPNHKDKNKQSGTNQAWFPKDWTSKDIKHAGEHVAKLKGNRNVHLNDGVPVYGMWKGVRVGVIRRNGTIKTIFPDSKQPTTKGGKKK
ncbi:MAG: EndoU domain-containing protein [Alphaproteobacteria bacterium]|nr:EndoU domain-containing protein [Alphaproteobacteria bacterium]